MTALPGPIPAAAAGPQLQPRPPATLVSILTPVIADARDGILARISEAEYFRLVRIFGNIFRFDAQGNAADSRFVSPCNNRLLLPPPPHRCQQPVGANPFIEIRTCRGFLGYPGYYFWVPHQLVPPRNANGTWPSQTVLNYKTLANHPMYICEPCWNLDLAPGQRQYDKIHNEMRQWRPAGALTINLCGMHSARPPRRGNGLPNTDRCVCLELSHRKRWSCRWCCEAVLEEVLVPRAEVWRDDLCHTHRTKTKRRDRTLSTWLNYMVPPGRRRGPACPIKGCGRTALMKAWSKGMCRMCLGCCGIMR